MSLLADAMEPCTYIDRTTRNDGYGGVMTVWQDGAGINAAIVYDTSLTARRAEVEGVKNLYTITTSRDITLIFWDVLRRESDGKLFRITSDGTDKKSPLSATLNMRVVTAEELESLEAIPV